MRTTTVLVAAAVIVSTFSLAALARPAQADEVVTERRYDDQGRLVSEVGVVRADPNVGFERHYWYADSPNHKNGHDPPGQGGGGPGGGDGGDGGSGTDCSADQNRPSGWYWTEAYSAKASRHAEILNAAAETWDAATSADIFGSITFGDAATAGVYDDENQHDWTDLGSGGTIAVTTTWYYRGSGQAVQSDARYNTYYAWSTDAPSEPGNQMDIQNIATHELGHTFGLDHPNGPSHKIGCLTMYAYGAYEETQKRTLGDGDILGIQSIYGA